MDLAIGELPKPFLNVAEIASSRAIMGLDTQLICDGTYFVAEENGALAGCGGWSRRATMYGGDVSPGRDPALLDPAKDAARVRAMYTHPAFVQRGVGRLTMRSVTTRLHWVSHSSKELCCRRICAKARLSDSTDLGIAIRQAATR